MKDRWKIIITGGIFALCAAAVAATVLYIFNGNAPKITFLLFIIVCVLCFGSLLVWTGYIVKAIKNISKQKKLQNAGLLQIPAEDVTRKEIEYNDEKGFKELEEHTLKFFENIVYPQGFTEFLKRYTAGLDGDNLAKEDEKLKRFVQR
ncbi:MAG: hypothetical protein K2O67_06430, partial [Clostridia bacterium]|nr:hypothetical protein [Clostridia bacterium]